MVNFSEKVALIWTVADKLRGPYKPFEYGRVILPLTVLRRLDCVLAPTRAKVLDAWTANAKAAPALREKMSLRASGQNFYNTSQFTFHNFLADPANLDANLKAYVAGFSPNARDILLRFGVSTPPSPSCPPHRSRVKRPRACTRSTPRSPWPAATAAA